MSEQSQPWDSVRRRWQPDSHVWDGLKTIPIETARNEVLDLCDGIDQLRADLAAANARAEAAEADRDKLSAQLDIVAKRLADMEENYREQTRRTIDLRGRLAAAERELAAVPPAGN